jgi:hypothetical protein
LAPDLDSNRLAALVFELASQLHAERSARIALEAALIRAGITAETEINAAAEAPLTRETTAAALARSMLKLMRVLRESDDPRTPTRHEAEERKL